MDVPQIGGDSRAQIKAQAEFMDVARLAYIYGLPCYEMARQRYRVLSLPRKSGPLRPNTFLHPKALSTPTTAGVTAVNSDALVSQAWIDLSRGPLVLYVPDAADRYYSLALIDFFTNNFVVLGRRSEGMATGNFLLAGPRWDGGGRAGMALIRAPTNAVWALVRILAHGSNDLASVHALQNQFTISRLGLSSEVAPHSADPLSRPVAALETTDLLTFFDVLNAALNENPPPERDKPILDRLQTIGVGPSLQFSRGDFTPPQLDALRQGLAAGRNTIWTQVGFQTLGPQQSDPSHWPADALLAQLLGPTGGSRPQYQGGRPPGWSVTPGQASDFGTDFLSRAQCALAALGTLPREQAMYFSTATDAAGAALNGGSRYVLTFPPGGLPPVDAFWSLTVYRTDENNRRWLVPNVINRYSVGSHTRGLRYGGDGSLEILIQHERPMTDEENWLPAPQGLFVLTLRAYLPRRELLDRRYTIPEVRRRSSPNDAFSTLEQKSGDGKLLIDERPIRLDADERLDFNHFGPLRKSYIVASSYRSGSQYLCWKLWRTGRLGAPSEVLNPVYGLPILMKRFNAFSPADYIAKLVARRASKNGVFGMKAHFHHFQTFMKEYPELLEALSPVNFIHISRRDKVAQAVSMARALQTKWWTSRMEEGPKPALRYDPEMIANCLRDIEEQDLNWRRWFEARNLTPFQVTYDDLLADSAAVVHSIVELLGVQNDEPDEVNVPPIEKQGDATNQEWIERFRGETQAGGERRMFT